MAGVDNLAHSLQIVKLIKHKRKHSAFKNGQGFRQTSKRKRKHPTRLVNVLTMWNEFSSCNTYTTLLH